jgi:hypothetical protein
MKTEHWLTIGKLAHGFMSQVKYSISLGKTVIAGKSGSPADEPNPKVAHWLMSHFLAHGQMSHASIEYLKRILVAHGFSGSRPNEPRKINYLGVAQASLYIGLYI